MRLHVWLTEEQVEAVTERAEVAGITRSEWIRASVQKVLETPEEQPGAPQGAPTDTIEEHRGALWSTEKQALDNQIKDLEMQITLYQEQIGTLPTITAERDRALDALTKITADWDRLKEQAGEVDRLRGEIAHRDQVIGERADEIRWLRGEVSKLNDKLTPAALPEQAGPGRRPWWRRIFE